MTTIVDRILDRLPSYYNKESKSGIRTIIESVVPELVRIYSNIDTNKALLGINTTKGDDLYNRWGSLLHLERNIGESDESYRARLKLSVKMLSGGTKDAITYAVAVGLNINEDSNKMARMINVFDAWEYDGTLPINKEFGNAVCIINISNDDSVNITQDVIIRKSIESVKASGINFYLFYSTNAVSELTRLKITDVDSLSLTTMDEDNVRLAIPEEYADDTGYYLSESQCIMITDGTSLTNDSYSKLNTSLLLNQMNHKDTIIYK